MAEPLTVAPLVRTVEPLTTQAAMVPTTMAGPTLLDSAQLPSAPLKPLLPTLPASFYARGLRRRVIKQLHKETQ